MAGERKECQERGLLDKSWLHSRDLGKDRLEGPSSSPGSPPQRLSLFSVTERVRNKKAVNLNGAAATFKEPVSSHEVLLSAGRGGGMSHEHV